MSRKQSILSFGGKLCSIARLRWSNLFLQLLYNNVSYFSQNLVKHSREGRITQKPLAQFIYRDPSAIWKHWCIPSWFLKVDPLLVDILSRLESHTTLPRCYELWPPNIWGPHRPDCYFGSQGIELQCAPFQVSQLRPSSGRRLKTTVKQRIITTAGTLDFRHQCYFNVSTIIQLHPANSQISTGWRGFRESLASQRKSISRGTWFKFERAGSPR